MSHLSWVTGDEILSKNFLGRLIFGGGSGAPVLWHMLTGSHSFACHPHVYRMWSEPSCLVTAYFYRASYAQRGLPTGRPAAAAAAGRPSGFCDSMRLGDFIDFISVERVKEKTTT